MKKMKFGKLYIDPACNPAILDTCTWDPKNAHKIIDSLDASYVSQLTDTITNDQPLPARPDFTPFTGSVARTEKGLFFLAQLQDQQYLLCQISTAKTKILGEPLSMKLFPDSKCFITYKTDAAVVHKYTSKILPEKGPRALGSTPRIGIGNRMSTAIFPAIFHAMDSYNFAANAIQNSLRELNMLTDVLDGKSQHSNYLFSFDAIEEGHTGATFEGLYLTGVLEALKSRTNPCYGADADHIQVKRTADGLERAKQVIDAARYYSFYTMDVSDVLNYQAVDNTDAGKAQGCLEENIFDDTLCSQVDNTSGNKLLREVLNYHKEKQRMGGQDYKPDEMMIGNLVGKYWRSLYAMEELARHLDKLKSGISYDLELSIDENPPEVKTCACLTKDVELMFLIREMQRRQIPITHIAPNFGVEKGVDYRCPDGLEGLEKRIARQCRIAEEFGYMLDCHSGDDLSSKTRKVVGRASQGKIHFKISPMLQSLYADVLFEVEPTAFGKWFEATLDYARDKAEAGSEFAIESMREYENNYRKASPQEKIFHYYHFAPVGLRDAKGQYINRELFYTRSSDFYAKYQKRVDILLKEVADDVFN